MNKSVQKPCGAQFINDLDPYDGRDTLPLPLAEELNSDSGWKEFQDICTNLEAMHAERAAATLKPKGSKEIS